MGTSNLAVFIQTVSYHAEECGAHDPVCKSVLQPCKRERNDPDRIPVSVSR